MRASVSYIQVAGTLLFALVPGSGLAYENAVCLAQVRSHTNVYRPHQSRPGRLVTYCMHRRSRHQSSLDFAGDSIPTPKS